VDHTGCTLVSVLTTLSQCDVFCISYHSNSIPYSIILLSIPYVLESNPHLNLICTSFCRFLKRKKKLVRGSNPHLSFNRPLPTRQTDSVMGDDGESDE